jgi:hypothetical protein
MVGKQVLDYLPIARGVSLEEKVKEAISCDRCIDSEIEVQACQDKIQTCRIRRG